MQQVPIESGDVGFLKYTLKEAQPFVERLNSLSIVGSNWCSVAQRMLS
jgi:hypothetical protein